MKLFYNDDYVAAKYAYDTTRKSKHIKDSLATNPVDDLVMWDPSLFTERTYGLIPTVHGQEYVDAVQTGTPLILAESQGFDWDEGIHTMALAHSTGLVAATTTAIVNSERAGSLSSGLHHASRKKGKGFCTFNGLAVAARQAVEMEESRVLILDFDAHAGGGTWDIINEYLPSVVQVDVTCAAFDTYEPEGESSITYTGHQDYRDQIRNALRYASNLDAFDFIIYNGGMDPINSGVSLSDIIWREKAVSDFIGDTPAVFALAGGYTWGNRTMEDVVEWHRITIETWASTGI